MSCWHTYGYSSFRFWHWHCLFEFYSIPWRHPTTYIDLWTTIIIMLHVISVFHQFLLMKYFSWILFISISWSTVLHTSKTVFYWIIVQDDQKKSISFRLYSYEPSFFLMKRSPECTCMYSSICCYWNVLFECTNFLYCDTLKKIHHNHRYTIILTFWDVYKYFFFLSLHGFFCISNFVVLFRCLFLTKYFLRSLELKSQVSFSDFLYIVHRPSVRPFVCHVCTFSFKIGK